MPVRRLPVRPDLEQLHRQAKDFLRALHDGDRARDAAVVDVPLKCARGSSLTWNLKKKRTCTWMNTST